jgi:hypothetical protein
MEFHKIDTLSTGTQDVVNVTGLVLVETCRTRKMTRHFAFSQHQWWKNYWIVFSLGIIAIAVVLTDKSMVSMPPVDSLPPCLTKSVNNQCIYKDGHQK